jgi:hypothetical protein
MAARLRCAAPESIGTPFSCNSLGQRSSRAASSATRRASLVLRGPERGAGLARSRNAMSPPGRPGPAARARRRSPFSYTGSRQPGATLSKPGEGAWPSISGWTDGLLVNHEAAQQGELTARRLDVGAAAHRRCSPATKGVIPQPVRETSSSSTRTGSSWAFSATRPPGVRHCAPKSARWRMWCR